MTLWIGIIAVLTMAGGLGGILYLIGKQQALVGIKTIQFAAIICIVPGIIVLGVLNVLGRDTIGTLFGVVVGYVLSGFGKE